MRRRLRRFLCRLFGHKLYTRVVFEEAGYLCICCERCPRVLRFEPVGDR